MAVRGEQLSVPFEQAEYDARLEKARRLMEGKGIEVLMIREPINIFYLTGYNTFGISNYAILFLPLEGEVGLLVRYLERPIAFTTSWLQEQQVEAWEDHENPHQVTRRFLEARKWLSRRVAFEKSSGFCSVQEYEQLHGALGIELADGSGIIEELRKIKSPAEIAFIRQAARYTEIGVKAGYEALAAGKTENEVVGKICDAMIGAGSEYPSSGPILTGGWKSGIPHTTFHRLKLKKGDAVLYELSGVYNRYNAPLMRSGVIGTPEERVRKFYEVCVEGLEAAIEAIRPGVTAGSVDDACRMIIEKAGFYENFRKRTGYAVGCSYPAGWGEGHIIDLKKGDERVLEPGMVFHMPPALRELNRYGVGVSETVVVTEKGCEVLTQLSRELHVAK
jgi:Xaa-Pro dipeptidase